MRGSRWVAALAALGLVCVFAQEGLAAWEPVWRRSVPFSAEAVATDLDGNAYVTGFVARRPPAGPWVMVLRKFDVDGNRLWSQPWRSPSRLYPHAAGFDVTVSPGGDIVYVVGAVMNDSTEVRIVRIWAYSPEGTLRWSRRSAEGVWPSAGAALPRGVVAGGWGWLARWDRDGHLRWIRPFLHPAADHCDVVEDLAVGARAAVYAVGFLDRTPTCNDSEGGAYTDADIVVQKRSLAGARLWTSVRIDAERDNDAALAVSVGDRQLVVSGHQNGHAWLARMTPRGRFVWQRRWGEAGRSIAVDVSAATWGSIYVAVDRRRTPTSTEGHLVVRTYSTDGDLQTTRSRSLTHDETTSGVTASTVGAAFVTAGVFAQRGDLWRLPP